MFDIGGGGETTNGGGDTTGDGGRGDGGTGGGCGVLGRMGGEGGGGGGGCVVDARRNRLVAKMAEVRVLKRRTGQEGGRGGGDGGAKPPGTVGGRRGGEGGEYSGRISKTLKITDKTDPVEIAILYGKRQLYDKYYGRLSTVRL